MKDILPVIMNASFTRLAVIDDYVSFIWTPRYYSPGDFELVLPAGKYMSVIAADYYVAREDDENVGIIEDIQLQRDEDGRNIMIVSGRFLLSILERRIIATQTSLAGNVGDCVSQLLSDNVITPYILDREIPNFVLGTFSVSGTMQAQYTGKNLLETTEEICDSYGLGQKVTLDSSNRFVYTMYEGTDRTYDQNVNPWVVFSDKYDNLLSSHYEENYRDHKTAVLVAGEGEGLDRRTLWLTEGETGLDRREIYKDQRQIRSNGGEISDADYDDMLEEAGREALKPWTTAFSGTVYFDNVKYKQDVFLGDLCVIENSVWGIYINARLVEVIESVSETGEYSIIPTFGI